MKEIKENGVIEEETENYTYREDSEIMRIQFIFEDKPDEETRNILKNNGFKWAPSQGAWQRQLTPNGKHAARRVKEALKAIA